MNRLILLLLVLLLAATSCATAKKGLMEDKIQSTALNKPRGTFPYIGEKLYFDIRHVATKAVVAAAHIEVGHTMVMDDGTRYIPISGDAASVALARLVAKVDDHIEAYISPETWETIYSYKHMNEVERERSFYVWFWPDEASASVERHYKGKIAKRDYILPPGTMDSMAWIYFARQNKFEKNIRYTWFTFDGWTLNRVSLIYEGDDDVWTELGFYHCKRIKIMRERSDAYPPVGALAGLFIVPSREIHVEEYELATAWFAEDDGQTPVRLVVKTGIGEFDLLLKNIERN